LSITVVLAFFASPSSVSSVEPRNFILPVAAASTWQVHNESYWQDCYNNNQTKECHSLPAVLHRTRSNYTENRMDMVQ